MHDVDITTTAATLTALIAFCFGLAGHYVGDHWVQTSAQACDKALDRPGCNVLAALLACARHVLGWSTTVSMCIAGACLWLGLPMRPGWFAAGMLLNAVSHFAADLRTPLIWLARRLGRGGYLDHVQVHRGKTVEKTGPGTALFHLDQSWHILWLGVAALVMAGPPAFVG